MAWMLWRGVKILKRKQHIFGYSTYSRQSWTAIQKNAISCGHDPTSSRKKKAPLDVFRAAYVSKQTYKPIAQEMQKKRIDLLFDGSVVRQAFVVNVEHAHWAKFALRLPSVINAKSSLVASRTPAAR